MINPHAIAVNGIGYGPLASASSGIFLFAIVPPIQPGHSGGGGGSSFSSYFVQARKDANGEFWVISIKFLDKSESQKFKITPLDDVKLKLSEVNFENPNDAAFVKAKFENDAILINMGSMESTCS